MRCDTEAPYDMIGAPWGRDRPSDPTTVRLRPPPAWTMRPRPGKRRLATRRLSGHAPGAAVLLLSILVVSVACGSRPSATAHAAPGEGASGTSQDSRPVGGHAPQAQPGRSEPSASTPVPYAAPSRTDAFVQARPIEDLFLLTGELNAVRSLDLVTPRTEMWRVQIKWMTDDGSDVREGDRVIEFDNTAVATTIEEKRLGHIQSRIDLESRRASLTAERADRSFAHERAKTDAEKARVQAAVPQDILSKREWQLKQAALRQAETSLEKARLELESFEVASKAEIENLDLARDKAAREIEAAQRTLVALTIKAPKAGIFVIAENWNEDRKYQVGDTVWPGQTIASIPELTAMEAVPFLADVDDGKIAPGMSARCILDTYPDRVFKGRVEEVSSIADKKGFRVRVSLQSDPSLMRPGMSVRVEVIRRSWDRALTVPRTAVLRRDGRAFVTKAGLSRPVEVRVAACTPTDCIIESGLAEGDRVLVEAGAHS